MEYQVADEPTFSMSVNYLLIYLRSRTAASEVQTQTNPIYSKILCAKITAVPHANEKSRTVKMREEAREERKIKITDLNIHK